MTTTKKMLINATQSEELRTAIIEGENQTLLDLLVERKSYKTKIGNIYLAKVRSVEPSLDAMFVNFGSERHGFLPFKEISPEYYSSTDPSKVDRGNMKSLFREGQTMMVQVEKEERGNKGAALTTFISLAGSYLVLMPNNPRVGGISRRIEGEERDELREALGHLAVPDGMGLIIRTAGVGKSAAELQWDLNTLLKQWESIKSAAQQERNAPFLIHQESDVVIRTIRDYLREDITEILVDDPGIYERTKHYLEQIRPEFVSRLKLYQRNVPLFSYHGIEHQIEAAHHREIRLPSGGSIVIDHTEALTAVDVNSSKANKGVDIEQTALWTNIEAARALACQLRLRDIGGLVAADFIDMPSPKHRREVEDELRQALKLDKARTQVGSISPRFGVLVLSRQRLRHSLGEATRIPCPRCEGWGTVRTVESMALSLIRMIEEEAIKPETAQIQAQLPVDIATFILNEKRDLITGLEKNHGVHIIIIPHPELESPHYRIRRLSVQEVGSLLKPSSSYQLVESLDEDQKKMRAAPQKTADEKPAVGSIFKEPAGGAKRVSPTNLVRRLIHSLFGGPPEPEDSDTTTQPPALAPPAATLPHAESARTSRERRRPTRHTPTTPLPPRRTERKIQAPPPPSITESTSTVRPSKAVKSQPQTDAPTTPPQVPPPSPPPAPEQDHPKDTTAKGRPRRGARGGTRRRIESTNETTASVATPPSVTEVPSEHTTVEKPLSQPPLQKRTSGESTALPPTVEPPSSLPLIPPDMDEYYESIPHQTRQIALDSLERELTTTHDTPPTTDERPLPRRAGPRRKRTPSPSVRIRTISPHRAQPQPGHPPTGANLPSEPVEATRPPEATSREEQKPPPSSEVKNKSNSDENP